MSLNRVFPEKTEFYDCGTQISCPVVEYPVVKQTPNWRRRETTLNVLSLGAFILVALIFVYLLSYGQALARYSSAFR